MESTSGTSRYSQRPQSGHTSAMNQFWSHFLKTGKTSTNSKKSKKSWKKQNSSQSSSHFCDVCKCELTSDNPTDIEQHLRGKKHKQAMGHYRTQEAANRKIVVGCRGLENPESCLERYFSRYGRVLKCELFPNKLYLVLLEMDSEDAAQEVLSFRNHCCRGIYLSVRPFIYKPPREVTRRLDKKQMAQEWEERRRGLQQMLEGADDVGDQLALLQYQTGLSDEDVATRSAIAQELNRIFRPYFINGKIRAFGSSVNKFGSRGCDLDLFLDLHGRNDTHSVVKPSVPLPYIRDIKLPVTTGPLSPEHMEEMAPIDRIKLLSRILTQSRSEFSETQTIPSKRCPLIRFYHKPSGIKCDLSISNRKALHNSHLLRLYGSMPAVRRVVCAVRLWAKCQGLAGCEDQGHLLSSYALTWLVIYYLQHHCQPRVVPTLAEVEGGCVGAIRKETLDGWTSLIVPRDATLPPSENTSTDVSLLRGFFEFYSRHVDWSRDGLCTHTAQPTPTRLLTQRHPDLKVGFMTVTDPFVLSHNIAANVNENTKFRFMAAVEQARVMSTAWGAGEKDRAVRSWGLAALMEPIPEFMVTHQTRLIKEAHPQAPICNLDLLLRPSKEPPLEGLAEMAQNRRIRPQVLWCRLVHDMALMLLATVYHVHLEQVGDQGSSEIPEDVRRFIQDIVEPGLPKGCPNSEDVHGRMCGRSPSDRRLNVADLGKMGGTNKAQGFKRKLTMSENPQGTVEDEEQSEPSEKMSINSSVSGEVVSEKCSGIQDKETDKRHSVDPIKGNNPPKRFCPGIPECTSSEVDQSRPSSSQGEPKNKCHSSIPPGLRSEQGTLTGPGQVSDENIKATTPRKHSTVNNGNPHGEAATTSSRIIHTTPKGESKFAKSTLNADPWGRITQFSCLCVENLYDLRKQKRFRSLRTSKKPYLNVEKHISELILQENQEAQDAMQATSGGKPVQLSAGKPLAFRLTIEQVYDCGDMEERVHLEMKPNPGCRASFPEFFSSFRHLLESFVQHNLLDE